MVYIRRLWTKEEINFLRQFYPRMGPNWCSWVLNIPIFLVEKKSKELGLVYRRVKEKDYKRVSDKGVILDIKKRKI